MPSTREPTAGHTKGVSGRAPRGARLGASMGIEVTVLALLTLAVLAATTAMARAGARDPILIGVAVGEVAIAAAATAGTLVFRRRAEQRRDALLSSVAHQTRARREMERERARLERLVSERTADLALREAEMRHLLDHVPLGILTLDGDGRIGRDRSLTADCLLGVPDPAARLSTHLAGIDAAFARRLELGWEQVSSGVLPLELALDQLPKQLHVGHHHFRTSFIPTQRNDDGARYLVVIEETTDAVHRTTVEEANLELAASFGHLLKDREAFLEFLSDAADLAAAIASSTAVDARLRHALHTLKGNALMMGLEPIGHHCHVLESLIAATGDLPSLDARDKLHSRVQRLLLLYGATERAGDGRVAIRIEDHDALVDSIRRAAPQPEVLRRAMDLLQEPVSIRFDRLVDQTASLVSRLGGVTPTFAIIGGSLRVDRRRFARFWSALVHVVRNAITHGIEPAADRLRQMKPARGGMVLAAHLAEGEMVIEVSDDGRGIDWQAIRAKATERGLPSATERDLTAALFAEGVSTAKVAGEFAGRGVGLGAVLAAVRELGGGVTVESSATTGTRFRFGFPRGDAAPTDVPSPRRHAPAYESDLH